MPSDVLVRPERLEKFLASLANSPTMPPPPWKVMLGEARAPSDTHTYLERWLRVMTAFPEFFGPDVGAQLARGKESGLTAEERQRQNALIASAASQLGRYADRLRKIWTEPDVRVRQWRLFQLRFCFDRDMVSAHRATIDPRGDDDSRQPDTPPDLTAFEQAMVYLDRHFERFRYCQNPECPAPYYVTASRKPTKFCSPICAGPAKREAKLRWYHAQPKGGKRNGKR